MAVTEEDIRTLAKRLRDRYGNDRRMSWRSFETEARRSLLLLDEAGLLVTPQASSAERSEEDDESLRSEPSAPGPQWAVLRPDDHNIYKAESSARRVLLLLGEAGEEDYRLYEVREVAGG